MKRLVRQPVIDYCITTSGSHVGHTVPFMIITQSISVSYAEAMNYMPNLYRHTHCNVISQVASRPSFCIVLFKLRQQFCQTIAAYSRIATMLPSTLQYTVHYMCTKL